MVQLALLGCAHIHTPGFVRNLIKRPDVKLVKVWDPNPMRSQKWAAEAGAAVVTDRADILKDQTIGGVIICSETGRHQELVEQAVKARKPMFVEKPLGMAAKDGYAMAKVIQNADVLFSTGYFMRGFAENLFIKQEIEKGTFGQITRVRASNCHCGALGDWFKARPEQPAEDWRWMADPALSGVGAFGDLGTHALDIMLWLMGEVDMATATIATGIKRYQNTDAAGSASFCDETGEGLMRFKNAAIGTLAAAWDDVANPVSLLVSGTEAHAAIINGKLYFKCDKLGIKDDQPYTQLPPAIPAGFDAWVNAVAGIPEQKLVSAGEAAYRSAVMEAMYEGSRKNKWVVPGMI